jgi:hypothetical protein
MKDVSTIITFEVFYAVISEMTEENDSRAVSPVSLCSLSDASR